MEMLNRAIEDTSEFAAFMRKAEGVATKPEREQQPQADFEPTGNRQQRRAQAKADRRAKAKS